MSNTWRHRWKRQAGLLAAAALVVVAGCGTQEYERRLQATVREMELRWPFDENLQPLTKFDPTPICLRIPKVFSRTAINHPDPPEGDAAIVANRTKIPSVDLGGAMLTYEAFIVDQKKGSVPYYMYVAVSDLAKGYGLRSIFNRDPKAVDGAMDNTGSIYKGVKESLAKTAENWEFVRCATPEGTQIAWQKLHAAGEQSFCYRDSGGKQSLIKLPGLLDIYARVEGDYLVMVAWRIPEMLQGQANFSDLEQLVAGSQTIR
jgi:hypothetical protein